MQKKLLTLSVAAALLAPVAAYAERALGCPVYPLEQIFRGWLRSPLGTLTASGPSQFAGRTTLNSGTAFATVSTRMVNSDSIIQFGFAVNSTGAMNVNSGAYLVVSSIVSGVSFALGYVDGAGRGPGGTFLWEIRRTT